AAPRERVVDRGVRPLRGRAEEQVPVDVRRNRGWAAAADRLAVQRGVGRLLGTGNHEDGLGALRPDGAVGPDVDLGDAAEDAGADDLDGTAQAVRRRALVAHLRADLLLGRRLAHLARLGDRVRQRLLAVDVLAQLHGGEAGGGVR